MGISKEDNSKAWDKSPISVIQNIRTPSIFFIGDTDLRVPPDAAYYYMSALK